VHRGPGAKSVSGKKAERRGGGTLSKQWQDARGGHKEGNGRRGLASYRDRRKRERTWRLVKG